MPKGGASSDDSHESIYNSTANGVVTYPVAKDMPLTGVWNYEPNKNGPVIRAEHGALQISRSSEVNAYNQWTKLAIQQHFQAQGGTIISFNLKYDSIQPATEVKLSLACGLGLRYDGRALNYSFWDTNTEWFHNLGESSMRIGDRKFCNVVLCISPEAIHIFENGNRIGIWRTQVPSPFQPVFDWQILEMGAELQATLSDITVVSSLFAPHINSPWDVAFSNRHSPPSGAWSITKQTPWGIPTTFSLDGYLRFSTRHLTTRNSWVMTQASTPLASDHGIVMYRLRVNTSGGSETKISIFGNYILRITKDGKQLEWVKSINDQVVKQGDSDIRVGGGVWTVVTMVYSRSSVTLFENGVAKFSASRRFISPLEALFHVQHLDAGTAVEVDLSHVRCVPVMKTPEILMRELQSDLKAFYPLKGNLCEATSAGLPIMDLVPTPGYTPTYAIGGPFGMTVDFSNGTGTNGALRFPPLVDLDAESFPCLSHTLALWLRVDQYPSGGDDAGIIGPLSLREDGRLEYMPRYVKNSHSEGSQPGVKSFTSTAILPLRSWVSIVVTYAHEDSTFTLYLNGEVDSIVYNAGGNSSLGAMTPIGGYLGATTSPLTGKLCVVKGQIGDVMFFKQRVHDMVVRAIWY